jgi:hypothetical protein
MRPCMFGNRHGPNPENMLVLAKEPEQESVRNRAFWMCELVANIEPL